MTEALASYAHVSATHRDRDGNPGMSESLGMPATVEEAKSAGEDHALSRGAAPGSLYWKQTSERTWLLMSGERYTHVRVAWVPEAKTS